MTGMVRARKFTGKVRVNSFAIYGYEYLVTEWFVMLWGNRCWRRLGVFISDAGEWEYWEIVDGDAMPEGRIMRGPISWWRYVATI